MSSRVLFLICALSGLHLSAYCQYETRLALGHSITAETLDSVRDYTFWIGSVGVAKQIGTIGTHATLQGMVDIQFAAVEIPGGKDFDLGANLSLELLWHLHRMLGLQLRVGSGPAYQSTSSTKQAKGFIFSNNFTLGLRFTLAQDKCYITPQARFRHMSNAHTKIPNNGIDSFIGLLAVDIPFQSEE